jgi:hypothetical protein
MSMLGCPGSTAPRRALAPDACSTHWQRSSTMECLSLPLLASLLGPCRPSLSQDRTFQGLFIACCTDTVRTPTEPLADFAVGPAQDAMAQ